jgi:hypothetical protein
MQLFIRIAFVWALAAAAPLHAAPRHSIDFWHRVADSHFTVPSDETVDALTAELVDMLGSTDPAERDAIAYSGLATWIYQKRVLTADALKPVVATLLANLKDGIGERDGDRVFKRSFSALTLAAVIARDNAAPFLTAPDFHRIEADALAYLAAEQDVRGYDEKTGWIHSAAHTADLLKFVARSPHLELPAQARLLDAIARKLTDAPSVFTHGEDERFARAVLSVVNRQDFDLPGFRAWTARAKPAAPPERPTAPQLRAFQNLKNLFAKLAVLLDSRDAVSAAAPEARDSVRAALKEAF